MVVVFAALSLGCSIRTDIRDATQSAAIFHQRFRAKNYDAIYSDASERFKTVRSKAEYSSMMKEIENNYGNLLRVEEKSESVQANTGAGTLEVFVFDLEFERAKAIERLTFARDQSGVMRLWMFELS